MVWGGNWHKLPGPASPEGGLGPDCDAYVTAINFTDCLKKMFLLPVKIQGNSYSFDIAESEYDNQIALSPANVKGEGIKFEKLNFL
jgi:hypothetical protein